MIDENIEGVDKQELDGDTETAPLAAVQADPAAAEAPVETPVAEEAPVVDEAPVEASADEAPVEASADEASVEASADVEEAPTAEASSEAPVAEGVDGEEPVEVIELVNPANPAMKWFAVHTYSQYEEKAKITLLDRVGRSKYADKFGHIVVPKITSEARTKTGKKRIVTRVMFPGYMMVQMELSDDTLMLVKDTPRISGFIGNQRTPRALADAEVLRLIAPDAAAAEEPAQKQLEVLFDQGENVKVVDGPFANFNGVVDEVKPDKARLRVLVSIFGRETPVELEYKQVEKIE